MIKTILVHLHGDGEDGWLLELARRTAAMFDAHLECLHVRRDVGSMLWRTPPYDIIAAGVGGGMLAPLKKTDDEWSRRAHDAFQLFCSAAERAQSESPPGTAQATATWREAVGGLEQILQRARFNDLVVDRRLPAAAGDVPERLSRLVLGCGRPVLIASSEEAFALAGAVAIAWKDTLETAKAMTAALPLLLKAERVVLLTAAEPPGAPVEGVSDALAWLSWHGVKAEARSVEVEGASAAFAVTQAARREGAGLIVMGAYGHHRSFELVLGGFTQDALDACQLPVLMFH